MGKRSVYEIKLEETREGQRGRKSSNYKTGRDEGNEEEQTKRRAARSRKDVSIDGPLEPAQEAV